VAPKALPEQDLDAVTANQRVAQNSFRAREANVKQLRLAQTTSIQQDRLLFAVRESNRLSRLLYEGGVASYLQVLDSDRNLFDAELVLAQVQRDELLSVVRLYRALGGGWN
jgi:multidrug efflux system outer membrane protein